MPFVATKRAVQVYFLRHAEQRSERFGDCRIWTWRLHNSGYGHYGYFNAHRLMYRAHHGDPPQDHVIHHTCHHRACIELSHLEAMHEVENSRLISPPDGCYACGNQNRVKRIRNGRFCLWCRYRMNGHRWPIAQPLEVAWPGTWLERLDQEADTHMRSIRFG